MGKKLFSLCMALALCLGLLPATALAAAPEGQLIYVGGVKISSSGYWTTDDDGNVTANTGEGTPTDNYIHYDADNNTLTLHNATIKEQLDYSENIEAGTYIFGSAIGVFNRNGAAELTITLVGTNTIAEVGKGIYVLASSTSTGGATLTITGGGSLDASASQTGIWVQSNNGDATLTIRDADVEAEVTGSNGDGVLVQAGQSSNASLSVNGGSLTATGSGTDGAGIRFLFGSSDSSSRTPSLTVSGNAMVKASGGEGGISTNSSTATEIKSDSEATSGGIVFNGNKGTVYGKVTLQKDLTIKSGQTLDIPSGASLTIGNDATLTVDGGTLTGDVTGTVNYKVTGVSLNTDSLSLEVGESETLTATITPSNATDQNVTWSSNNESVATVGTSGKVTAIKAGTATITATAADGSGKSASCSVTVKAPPEPEPEPEPTPPPYIPPTYAVTTPETTGGTVTVSPSRASSGRTVTITATPDTGFALESLTVLDSRGNEIALTDKGDGKYTFTMPASRVTVQASFAPVPLPFEDVAPGAWYESAVRYAYFHNIMEGMRETEFAPATALTRAMAVQILYNLEGQPDISSENLGYPYEDVDAQAWYGDAVYWARLTGVATGYGDGTFQPGDSITRQEFAQMLYNYAKYKDYDLSAEGDLSTFPDANSIADWAEAAMSWANGNQLINGHDDGTIDAAGIGTRAQAASILMKFDQNLVEN